SGAVVVSMTPPSAHARSLPRPGPMAERAYGAVQIVAGCWPSWVTRYSKRAIVLWLRSGTALSCRRLDDGAAADRLLALGADADEVGGRAQELFQSLDIGACRCRKVVEARAAFNGGLPARQVLVDWPAAFEHTRHAGEVVDLLTVQLVGGADAQPLERIEDVQARQGDRIEAVHLD